MATTLVAKLRFNPKDKSDKKDMGPKIGALNPRQVIFELRNEGFDEIIKTRWFTIIDQDGKKCRPGEYYIPEQKKQDYFEPVNIWSVVVLPPASRKTRVHGEVVAPLKKWESEQKEILQPQIKSIESKRKTGEVRLKELRNIAAKADESKYISLQEDIERLENELDIVPLCPQIWASDVTPEQLATIMAVNEEAMAILSDEGCIFDILGGLYSDGKANIDLFLQAHSASPVRVDRSSKPPIFMQRPVLSMGLTIQPEVIKSICRNKTFRGRGLLGRCLYTLPKSNIGKRSFNEPPISTEVIQNYRKALQSILNHPDHIINNVKTQHILTLEPLAYEKWLSYAKTVEALMGEEIGHLSHVTDWAGKLPGAIARIAALLHIMRYSHCFPWHYPISLDDMASAVKIGHVLTNHALRVFDLLRLGGSQQLALDIYKWIKDEKHICFTRRVCSRKFRRAEKEEFKSALELLEEKDIIREREPAQAKAGRKSNIFDVNPRLFLKEN